MKRINFQSASILLLLLSMQACKEIGPTISKGGTKALVDTSYTTTVPTTRDTRVVVIEEYTGAKCTNCPYGHAVVKSLITANPGRIAAIAYHKFGTTLDEPAHLTNPPTPGYDPVKDDFRRTEATNIMNAIFGNVSSIPKAGIDRVFDANNNTVYDRGDWAGKVATRKAIPSALNLSLNLTVATDKKSAVLAMKGIYTEAVTEKQVLNVMLVESELEAAQKYPDSTSEKYIHEHVFRKAYTPAEGRAILSSVASIQPGQAFELSMKLDFETLWKLEHCDIIVFVSNNGQSNKVVQQAAQIKVLP